MLRYHNMKRNDDFFSFKDCKLTNHFAHIVLIKDNLSTAHNMVLAIFVCKDKPISKTKFTYMIPSNI